MTALKAWVRSNALGRKRKIEARAAAAASPDNSSASTSQRHSLAAPAPSIEKRIGTALGPHSRATSSLSR